MIKGKWLSRSSHLVEGCGFWRQFNPQGHFSKAGGKCCKETKVSSPETFTFHFYVDNHNIPALALLSNG